jgi:hypothetical protein
MGKAVIAVLLLVSAILKPVVAETLIPPMMAPIPGTWEDRSEIIEMLPLAFHSIWYEPRTVSLIHVQISAGEAPLDRDVIERWGAHMRSSTSFWGEPAHPNAAQFFANEVYLQPTTYDEMIVPFLTQALETKAGVDTPAIWALQDVTGNPHIFFHAQLTPRLAIDYVDGQVNIAESYVPLSVTRVDLIEANGAESIVVEVQTKGAAIDDAVDALGMPVWLKDARLRYCAVLHAAKGFGAPARSHVWFASPVDSGIDCDDILAGFGQ